MQSFISLLPPTSRRSDSVLLGSIMVKPAALLLLLAVLSQRESNAQLIETADCPITYFGETYEKIEVISEASSFKFCFKNSSSEADHNCVKFEGAQDIADVSDLKETDCYGPGSFVHSALPDLGSTSDCQRKILLFNSDDDIFLKVLFFNFKKEAVMRITAYDEYTGTNVTMKFTAGNSPLGSLSLTKAQTRSRGGEYINLSGCRLTEAPFAIRTGEQHNSTTGTTYNCNPSQDISSATSCDVCSDTKCLERNSCTVTGFTVIDFQSRVQTVPDRCVYSLIKSQGSSQFELLAGFLERRRQDVVFLDHLMLRLSEPVVNISLEQGGRVKVNDSVLSLNTTALPLHGVELSKDQHGVTVNIPFANMTVFFDGNTAHVRGPGPFPPIEGLCGNSTDSNKIITPSAAKATADSFSGCEIAHNDTVDPTINCTRSTERCNLMDKTFFKKCHSSVDREPYKTACTNTLCKYPELDGINCQFFEAYSQICRLDYDITLEDWRSQTSCSPDPQASCLEKYCSTHEFCGKQHGATRCLCRAIFASKYKETTSGQATACMGNSSTLTLVGCMLEEEGIDYSDSRLKGQNCTAHIDQQTHMLTFSFNSSNMCRAEVARNGSNLIFKYSIVFRNNSVNDIINTQDQVVMNFSCTYSVPENQNTYYTIPHSSVVQQVVSGDLKYTLTMNTYNDRGRKNLVQPTSQIELNQTIWVEIKSKELEGDWIVLVTKSCWATDEPSPDMGARYDIIINGCPNPVDQTVTVEGNGLGTTNVFSFNMFQFFKRNTKIYLHCRLELCPKELNSCAPVCS